jgi:hypothetical protein
VKIADGSLENVTQLRVKYLGKTVIYQNSIQEGINKRLNSGNAFYVSVQNILSSRLLSENKTIKIHRY